MSAEETAFVVQADEARNWWSRDALWSVLVPGERTRGDFTLIEQLMPHRNGAPLHMHERLHEYFYLIDGEIRFQTGDALSTATSGAAVSIPPGTAHGFVVVSDTARVLNMYTPGGFDDRLAFLGTPADAKTLPPTGTTTDEPTDEQQAAFAERLLQLHDERWADGVEDLLADERQRSSSPSS